MIERHQDYVLTIPSIAAGKSILSYPFQLGSDGPFILRGVGMRITPPAATRSQIDVTQAEWRFTNRAGAYVMKDPIATPQYFGNAFGQNGFFKPVYGQLSYPPLGIINVDYTNYSPRTINNLQIMFRGVTLFADGQVPNPTYPPKCSPLDFTYQSGKGSTTDPAIILQTTDDTGQRLFQVDGDADFVIGGAYGGQYTSTGDGGLYSTTGWTELYVQLFDANLKPYSNVPVHIDWLMGSALGTGQGGTYQFITANSAPGLFYPEIYLPKNRLLYYRLIRNDAAYTGVTDSLPVRIAISWVGRKVYASL
jgi:hypothetical protein